MPINYSSIGVSDHADLGDVATPHAAAGVFSTWEKIADSTVSGSAVTSSSISSLDLDTDGTYFYQVSLYNPTGSTSYYSLYINSDTTATNYYYQRLQSAGAAVAASNANNGQVVALTTGTEALLHIRLHRDVNSGYVRGQAIVNKYSAGDLTIDNRALTHEASANLTSIDFTASVASSIGIGSHFILYKVSR